MSPGTKKLLMLSGPNLDQLGQRQPELYGTTTLKELISDASEEAAGLGLELAHVHSNHEGALIEAIHAARGEAAAIMINPGAFTHYSWAVHDALAAFDGPVIELHLTNPAARETFRRDSVVSPVATAVVAGFGPAGYRLAIRGVAYLLGLAAG